MPLPFRYDSGISTLLQGVDDKRAPERPRCVHRHLEPLTGSVERPFGIAPNKHRFAGLNTCGSPQSLQDNLSVVENGYLEGFARLLPNEADGVALEVDMLSAQILDLLLADAESEHELDNLAGLRRNATDLLNQLPSFLPGRLLPDGLSALQGLELGRRISAKPAGLYGVFQAA